MRGKGSNTGKEAESRPRRSSRAVTVLLVLILLAGIVIMAYPSVSDWYNRLHQSRAIASYNQAVSSNESGRNEQLWNAAVRYNEKLAESGIDLRLSQYNAQNLEASTQQQESSDNLVSADMDSQQNKQEYTASEEAEEDSEETEETEEEKLKARRKEYLKTLDVSGTGIMGYIDIDKVDIHLPIYHDTSEGVLQVAVGHLAGTSLPVGGTPSHCVLTGHTGLPSAKLFTDIDQLEEGDTFQLTVLDHVLTYEVDNIQVVLPAEADSLRIEEGRDLCTLVTCTPYGINTHRLLVTGHRIPTPKSRVPSEDWQQEKLDIILQMLAPFLLAALFILLFALIRKGLKRRNRRRKKHD